MESHLLLVRNLFAENIFEVEAKLPKDLTP
jgi:hypothetical protein